MNTRDTTCHSVGDLLVDYCDGELPPPEARRVEGHLAGCGACRSQVVRLRRSLEAAQAVWRELVETAAPVRADGGSRRRPVLVATGVAAAAVLVVGLGWWMASEPHRPNRALPPRDVAAQQATPDTASEEPLSADDVEAIILREVQSARLAVSARLLADQPKLRRYHQSAQRYLAETYGSTRRESADQTQTDKGG